MPWTAYIDGGSRGNPGPAAAGVCLRDESGKAVLAAGFFLGRTTNNQAEYQGLLNALKLLRRAGAGRVLFVSDSELMVRQINGKYKVKSPDLRPLYKEAMAQLDALNWQMRHTLREGNTEADALANDAMDAGADVVRIDVLGLLGPAQSPRTASSPEDPSSPPITPSVSASLVVPPARGQCEADMRRGQRFDFTATTPAGLCVHLCAAALPSIIAAGKERSREPVRVCCGRRNCGATLEISVK